jgi:hypothetical protein
MKQADTIAEAKARAEAIRQFDKDNPGLTLDEFADLFRFQGEAVSRETIRKALGRNRVQP